MNKKCLMFLSILISLFATEAEANYTCVGTVTGLSVGATTGYVIPAKIAGIAYPLLCSINTSINGVSTDMCKNVYAMLLTAQVMKKNVVLWFNDDASGGTCATHGSWTILTGWYYGPQMQ